MKLYSFPVKESAPHDLFTALAPQPYSLFFDSADPGHELSRYSFIAYHPLEMIEAKNGVVSVTNKDQQLTFNGRGLDVLQSRLEVYGLDRESRPDLPPFQGGAAGFFGYDLARDIENLPVQAQDNGNVPDMAIGIYDQLFAYDHHKNKGWFLIHATSEEIAQSKYQHFLRLIKPHQPFASLPPTGGGQGGGAAEPKQWQTSHTRQQYEESVRRVIDYIYAGDIFQCNLSQRFETALPEGFDIWVHYLALRRVNAAPFACYMNFGAVKISSASPERFLFVEDRLVETRPIKGTQKRVPDEALDQLYRNTLENSEKDRAENTMIVDLMRNDLSKVCEDHSIKVPQLCQLESFARVHHLVSIVNGTLRADQSPAHLLRACFPGGSITGAPKVRAMEIIEELEQKRRGPYCGAIGYIGYNGTMDTSIAIRTLVYDGNTVSFNVGGGIVADSKPADEYDETMAKAEAIFNSFEISIEQEDVIARSVSNAAIQ